MTSAASSVRQFTVKDDDGDVFRVSEVPGQEMVMTIASDPDGNIGTGAVLVTFDDARHLGEWLLRCREGDRNELAQMIAANLTYEQKLELGPGAVNKLAMALYRNGVRITRSWEGE